MDRQEYSREKRQSWAEVEADIEALSRQVLADYRPDVVVAVAEGGWIPARLFENFLPNAKYLSIGCTNYDDNERMLVAPVLYQTPDEKDLVGKTVLLIDEVCESGTTLRAVSECLRKMRPKDLRSAVLHRKIAASFKPDFFAHEVSDIWVIYPWVRKPRKQDHT